MGEGGLQRNLYLVESDRERAHARARVQYSSDLAAFLEGFLQKPNSLSESLREPRISFCCPGLNESHVSTS